MPRRKPKTEEPRRARKRLGSAPWHLEPSEAVMDPVSGLEAQTRYFDAFKATKAYICPGCGQPIEAGHSHLVVVPLQAPELRRHWHTSCWRARDRRPPVGS